MADDSTILEYIVRAQDQARGLLEQQVQLLQKMSAGVNQVVAATQRQVTSAQASAQATAKQADGLMRLLRTQTELENSNKRTLAAFNAVTNALTAGNRTWAERVGMVKQLDAAVQKNSVFMERYGRQWTDLIAKLRAAGPVSKEVIDQLQRGALTFGAVATEQKAPIKSFGQQQTQQARQQAQEQARAAQEAARAAKMQGDALDGLIKQQQALAQSNARMVQGATAVNTIMQQGGRITQQTAAGIQILNTGMTQSTAFVRQYGQQWAALVAQMQAGANITPQMQAQFNQLTGAFRNVTQGAGQTNSSLQAINATAIAVSGAVGYLGAQLGNQLRQELSKSINEASKFQSTFIGLSSISKAFGQDVGAVNEAARELASDGLITIRESAIALRNLMMTGFNIEEAVNLAKGFKDIASFNRQASLELGYAVTSATEGIKNQNSLLVDNAGLTKNLTIILKELGLSEQDLAKASSDVNVRQALYNGLLKEMAPMLGDAERLTNTYQGSVSKLTVQTELLRVSIGEKLLPVMQAFNNFLSSTFEFLRNGEGALANAARFAGIFAAALAAVTAAVLALIGVVGLVTGTIVALTMATGASATAIGGIILTTVGWGVAIAGVIAVIGTLILRNQDMTAELQKTAEEAAKTASGIHKYRDELEALAKTTVDPKTVTVTGDDKASKAFQDALKRMKEEFPRLNVDVKNLETVMRSLGMETNKATLAMLEAEAAMIRAELAAMGFNGSAKEIREQLAEIAAGVTSNTSIWEDLWEIITNRLSIAWQGLKNDLNEIKKAFLETVDQVKTLIEWLSQIPGMQTLGRGFQQMWKDIRGSIKETADSSREMTEDEKKRVNELISNLENNAKAHKGITASLQEQRDQQAALTEEQKRYMALTKGQVATTGQFSTATSKLAEDFRILTKEGVTESEAARLLKKDVDELWKAHQTGVGTADDLLKRLFGLNKAYERKNRLEQEAEQHSLELENRTRLLSRSIVDLQSGVDSNGQKWGLLTSMMAKHGLEFDAQMMRIPGMASLVKELSDRVGLSAGQYNLLAQAQRSLFEQQNRVAEGTSKARQEAENFQNTLFEQTEGVRSASGIWLLLQQDLKSAQEAHLSLSDTIALFKGRWEAVVESVAVGSDRWKEATAEVIRMNAALEGQKFLGGLLTAGQQAEANAQAILGALSSVETQAMATGVALTLPQIQAAQSALEALTADGLGLTEETLARVNAKLAEFAIQLAGPEAAAERLRQSLAKHARELTTLAGEAGERNAELSGKWAQAIAIQDQAVRDAAIRKLLPDIEAFVEQANIGSEAWLRWSKVLAEFGKGPFEDIKQRQEEVAAQNIEFQRNVLKFGRQTAEQQIRDAELAATEQVRTLNEALRKIKIGYASLPFAAKAAFAKVTQEQEDAIKRQIAMVQAQATLTGIEGKPEFEDFARELRDLLKDIGKATGTELDKILVKLGVSRERIEAITTASAIWRDRITETNRQLANTTSIIQNIASIISAIDPESDLLDAAKIIEDSARAGAAFENLLSKIGEIKDRLKAQDKIRPEDIVDLTSFSAQVATALSNAISGVLDMKSGFSKIISGASLGKEIGGMIGAGIGQFLGGPAGALLGKQIGNIGGTIIGTIFGAFHKANWEKIGQDVARRFGGPITEELAKQIDATSKMLEGGTKAQRNLRAELLHITDILEEQGGITAKNIQRFANEAVGLFEEVRRGGETSKQALEQLNGVFTSMVTYMDESLGGMVDQAMLGFIRRVQESGIEVKEVTEFLKRMADAALDAVNAVTRGFTGRFTAVDDTIAKITEMTEKRADLVEKMNKEDVGTAKWNQLNSELQKLDKEFERIKKQALGLSAVITDAATNSQERFDRIGRLVGATFDAAIASGKSFTEALAAIRPSLQGLADAAAVSGFQISASLQNLIDLSDWGEANKDIADGIAGLDTLMKTLANQGRVNQDVFNDFGNEAVAQMQDVLNSGLSADNAMRLMQPTLQTLYELQQRFGYITDEATQKLLDEAKAAGVVGDQHKSASERMVDGINKVVTRLDVLLNRMFGIPIAADDAEGGVSGAANNMKGSIDGVIAAAETAAERIRAMGKAAVEAGDEAYEANSGVIYGNSPGGLTDMNERLHEAINNYYSLGAAGREAADGMSEAMLRHIDVLRDLDNMITEASLEGSELAMFRLMQDKEAMIEKFMKDIEGASDDVIQSGLEKIDRLFDIRANKVKDQGQIIRQETEKIQQQFSLSAKMFEQTLDFIHNGLQRSVTLKGLSLTSEAFTPQSIQRTVATAPLQIPMSGFAEGVMASPREPRVGVFGEKKPELGGTVEFMKEALVGALKEAGIDAEHLAGNGGEVVFDFRGANIPDEAAFKDMLERVAIPHLKTLQRRNFRGYRSATVRSTNPVRIKVVKPNG